MENYVMKPGQFNNSPNFHICTLEYSLVIEIGSKVHSAIQECEEVIGK